MERLWYTFRPYSAGTITRLELALKIEKLSDRFDSLIWACETPLASLNTLRSSLVAFHGGISSPGDATAGSLQVRSIFYNFRILLTRLISGNRISA